MVARACVRVCGAVRCGAVRCVRARVVVFGLVAYHAKVVEDEAPLLVDAHVARVGVAVQHARLEELR